MAPEIGGLVDKQTNKHPRSRLLSPLSHSSHNLSRRANLGRALDLRGPLAQGQETGTGGKSIRPEVPFDLESRKQSGDSQAPAALVWLASPAASSSAGGRLLDLHLEDCGLPLSLSQMGLPILRVWECSSDPGPSSQMTALPHHWCGVSM